MKTSRVKVFRVKTKVFRVKTLVFRIKTLVAALAIAGFATACDRDTARSDAYVAPESSTIDRATTAQGTTQPDALSSVQDSANQRSTSQRSTSQRSTSESGLINDGYSHDADLNRSGDLAKADHEETIQFSGTELSPDSESKLEDLVKSLDKDKPVKIIVAMDQSMYEDETGRQTATSSEQPSVNRDSREDYTAALGQRVESVKEFMQEQGVEVTQWQFERMEEQDLAQQRNAQDQAEDVQSVRLVIAANPQGGRVGTVLDE